MRKVLGIVLLVLAVSLVSVPAFAEKAELSLKYWHAGVGGADLWVADYQIADYLDYEEDDFDGYVFSKEKLVLQPGMGRSFILSGSYFLSPSASVGISYWGLSRADTVGVEFIEKYDNEELIDDGETQYSRERYYLLTMPWWEMPWEFWSNRLQWTGYYDFDGKGVLVGEGSLSMSALDIVGTKTLAGSGWEVGLSGGVRRAVFTQNQSTGLELSGGYYDEDIEDIEYVYHYFYPSAKWNLELDSRLSVSAIGPQVGIEGKYALGNRLVLKAGGKAGLLFGTATSDASWSVDYWYYDEGILPGGGIAAAQVEEGSWVLEEFAGVSPDTATDSVQISTYDVSASLDYQITEQWSVEAGYYASLWKGVPSLHFFKYYFSEYNGEGRPCDDPIDRCALKKGTWEQPEARTITVRGFTLGVNFKF